MNGALDTRRANPVVAIERLDLIPVTAEHRQAFQMSRAAFAAFCDVTLPEGWPEFPEAFTPQEHEGIHPWTGYIFLHRADRRLIGNGGFVSAPHPVTGAVEIGYEIAPEFRNLGFATEAARTLVALAFDHGAAAVIAHSLPEPNASNAVMQKLGMRRVADISDPAVGHIWRWQVDRPAG